MTFLDSVFRVEHIPENSKTGIALEIRINKYVFDSQWQLSFHNKIIYFKLVYMVKDLNTLSMGRYWC